MPRCGVLCRAALCGTVCRAILSRVAWLVVSFLYSFVGKSAASLVFKRRQREGRRRKRERERREREKEAKGGREGEGERGGEAKGKLRRPARGGAERGDWRERDDGSKGREGG